MSKKKKKTSPKRKKTLQRCSIDHIPHCRRKPRTGGLPRRRTDFSLFFPSSLSFSKSHSGKDSGLESLDGADKPTVTELDRKGNVEFPLAACSSSQDKKRQLFSNAVDVPLTGIESVGHSALFEASGGRNVDKQNRDTSTNSDLSPKTSQATGSSIVNVAPGSVVWARTASQEWWPAEVMGERSSVADSPDESVDGLVLIKYFGTRQSTWVDPARNVSEFDECFEKRIDNRSNEFQDALKQALHQREHRSLSKHFSELSDDYNCLNQGYQTPEKWNSSSSSRMDSPCVETRRGKRERKPKLHFDEEPLNLTLPRGVRRIKIMRSLGLAAPIGSPF